MNFDQILSAVGGFGRYQKTLYVWICLPRSLLAFHMMVSIFTGSSPHHHCRESSSSVHGNQSSLPGTLSGNFSLSDSSCFSSDVNRTERVPCGQGWVYSKETFQSTTVTEWDLVCDRAGLNSLGSSVYMYGRRFVLLLSIALQTLFWSRRGLCTKLPHLCGSPLSSTEWTCTKRRMLAGIITDYAFEREEAIALLRKAALVNGRVLPPAVQIEKLSGGKQSYSAVDLVRTPQMRKRAFILFYIWYVSGICVVNVLVYYGLSLGVSRLGTNLYLTQFVFGLVEIPARSVVLLVLPYSRRLSLSGFLAVGGLACLLTLAVPEDDKVTYQLINISMAKQL
ncbi:hypothetical protein KUCAC02_011563 [Chaenocephalus aceratus]|uniref:Uncharacterized protein n=1 Tax=Chaenocephalus aceratus TaxID=36190 RepID=A0ACB9WXP6_CHAAC|nr:hypothetical protein KUCAC02_011563 [Chaenocephalus aceratus]